MTAKIGKLSLIIGAIINILLIAAGLVIWKIELLLKVFSDDMLEHFWFMLIPFGVMLVTHFTAWLICLKTNKKGEPPQEKPSNMGVFFKTYFYLWTVVTIAIAICGMLFLNFCVYRLSNVFCCNMMAMGLAWLCTIIVCTMVWAAFNAWAANEAVGVVVALIALILLAGSSLLTGVLYKQWAETFNTRHAEEAARAVELAVQAEMAKQAADAEAARQAAEAAAQAEIAAARLATENDFDRAFRFMTNRLNMYNNMRPIDIIRKWSYYPNDYYSSEIFYGNSDFQTCHDDFYSLLLKNMRSSSGLLALANYYSEDMRKKEKILSSWRFEHSGAKGSMKILLWAHDDIYAKENREEVLTDIYRIMSKEPHCQEEPCYYFPNSYYFDMLQYISEETLNNINTINRKGGISGSDLEWANMQLTAWAYSFWGRRHHDNVDRAAYKILKIIEWLYK